MNKSIYFCTYTPFSFFTENTNALLCYQGPFSTQVISRMGQELRHDTAPYGYVSWKLFAVFIELVQNVHFHSVEYGVSKEIEPLGVVLVEETAHNFEVTTANLIKIEAMQPLKTRCEAVNKLSISELRKFKNELLSTSVDEKLAGGNIGLVQVVLLSQEKIKFDIYPIDEQTAFFTLTTTIKK